MMVQAFLKADLVIIKIIIKFNDLDISLMKRKGLLNKHFSKKSIYGHNIVNFLFLHYKSLGTMSCHSNQGSYPTGTKNKYFFPTI